MGTTILIRSSPYKEVSRKSQKYTKEKTGPQMYSWHPSQCYVVNSQLDKRLSRTLWYRYVVDEFMHPFHARIINQVA